MSLRTENFHVVGAGQVQVLVVRKWCGNRNICLGNGMQMGRMYAGMGGMRTVACTRASLYYLPPPLSPSSV